MRATPKNGLSTRFLRCPRIRHEVKRGPYPQNGLWRKVADCLIPDSRPQGDTFDRGPAVFNRFNHSDLILFYSYALTRRPWFLNSA